MADKDTWTIDFHADDTRKEYQKFFKDHPEQKAYKSKFEKEASTNPHFHAKYRRIVKLKGKQYEDLYRWQESNTRITYHPEKPAKMVWVIETTTATDAFYKKRSKK